MFEQGLLLLGSSCNMASSGAASNDSFARSLAPSHPSNEGYAAAKRLLEQQVRFSRQQLQAENPGTQITPAEQKTACAAVTPRQPRRCSSNSTAAARGAVQVSRTLVL